MSKIKLYKAENEPVLGYHKGSPERKGLKKHTMICLILKLMYHYT